MPGCASSVIALLCVHVSEHVDSNEAITSSSLAGIGDLPLFIN